MFARARPGKCRLVRPPSPDPVPLRIQSGAATGACGQRQGIASVAGYRRRLTADAFVLPRLEPSAYRGTAHGTPEVHSAVTPSHRENEDEPKAVTP